MLFDKYDFEDSPISLAHFYSKPTKNYHLSRPDQRSPNKKKTSSDNFTFTNSTDYKSRKTNTTPSIVNAYRPLL